MKANINIYISYNNGDLKHKYWNTIATVLDALTDSYTQPLYEYMNISKQVKTQKIV